MGCVDVLNPHDVLKHGFNYNHMPLISPKLKDSLVVSTNNSDLKTVSNSNRRRRSPQKKNGLSRSSIGQSLVNGKVTILKRGEAFDSDEKKKIALFDKEKEKEKEKEKKKKTVFFDKENENENKVSKWEKKKEVKSGLVDKTVKKEKEKSKAKAKKNEKKMKEEKNESPESVEKLLMRLGPEPVMLPRLYAGSGFIDSSPSPRSVPVPSFLAGETKDDYASSYLRSLLKLGF